SRMDTQNIAIIGAGIMGLSAVFMLQQRGHSIILLDKAALPVENASFKAGGMLAPYSEIEHMNPLWIDAGLAGIECWKSLSSTLGNIGFQQSGSLFIAHPEDRYVLERFAAHLPQMPKLSEEQICAYEPQLK